MLKEASIIIFAICCVFSIIPLTWIPYPSPIGALLSISLLFIVILYAVYDVGKLYGNKKYRLAKYFIVLLTLSIIFSFIIVMMVWPYFSPPTIQ
jgi:hypothetical protein